MSSVLHRFSAQQGANLPEGLGFGVRVFGFRSFGVRALGLGVWEFRVKGLGA